MSSSEKKDRGLISSPQENLESPFLDEELFVTEIEAESEPHLTILQSNSAFERAFEQVQTAPVEPEALEEEFVDEDWVDENDFSVNQAEAKDETALSEESLEEPYDEEAPDDEGEAGEEEEAFTATALDEEPVISDEDSLKPEEEGAYPLEEVEYNEEQVDLNEENSKLEQHLEAREPRVLPVEQEPFEFDIIDKDTRKQILDTTLAPFRWICSIELFTKNPKYGGYNEPQWRRHGKATGVLIGPSYVLTAAHILWITVDGKQKSIERIVVTPGRNEEKAPFGSTEAGSNDWRTPKKWDPNNQKRMWDFAVIRLKEALGNKTFNASQGKPLGWWGSLKHGRGSSMKPLKPEDLLNHEVRTASYPGDRCGARKLKSKRQIELCENRTPEIWATTQWYARGQVTGVDHKQAPGLLWHTIDTTKGQSGAPIWYFQEKQSGKQRSLVGLHVGSGGYKADKRGKIIPRDNLAVWIRSEVLKVIRDMMGRLQAGQP
jgi:V8-like Glu-specific endopeptidase